MPEDYSYVDEQRKRRCVGKYKHLTLDSAKAQAKALHKKYKARYDAYQCPFCGHFHVGHNRSPEAIARRIERRGY